jgi:hypothetical protein
VYWGDPVDLETLKTILDVLPDLYPCELAIICRKPCREVRNLARSIDGSELTQYYACADLCAT